MTLRESQNWHIDDHFPGVAIDAIPLVSEQLNSLYARTYQKVHLQRSFTKLAGVIFLAKDLEYHRNNFLHACHMAGVPSLHTVPDQTHTTYTEVAKFEAIAYINTVGTINTWIDNHRPRLVPAPKMLEITRSFRNKQTAHRSIDAPRGESEHLQDVQAIAFWGGSLWNAQGELVVQIQEPVGQTHQLNIAQDHPLIARELLDAFRTAVQPPPRPHPQSTPAAHGSERKGTECTRR